MDENYIRQGYIVCKAIGDAVNSKEVTIPETKSLDDFENRVRFIERHNLATLYSYAADKKDFGAYTGYKKYNGTPQSTQHAIFKQISYDLLSEQLSKRFSENKIRHIFLKGSQLQKFYPKNVIRTSNDIDIYVSEEQFELAKKAMLAENFTVKSEDENKGEFGFSKEPRYYVELHTNLEGYSNKQKAILLKLADNAKKVKGEQYALTDSDCYIYTLFHLYKHFVNSGVGVRMFLDVYLIKKNGNIDFDYAERILKELEIDGFVTVVDEVALVLFEGKKESDDIRKVVEFIFDSGIFGKKHTNLHLKEINTGTQHLTKAKRFKLNYGLGFQAMKKRYPILKKLPFLYPFSYIHRFFYGLVHKRDVLKSAVETKKSISSDKVDEYKEIFKIAKIKM